MEPWRGAHAIETGGSSLILAYLIRAAEPVRPHRPKELAVTQILVSRSTVQVPHVLYTADWSVTPVSAIQTTCSTTRPTRP